MSQNGISDVNRQWNMLLGNFKNVNSWFTNQWFKKFFLRLMGHRFYLCLISVWINYVKLPRTSHAHKEILAKRSGPQLSCGRYGVRKARNCHVHIDGGPGRTVHPLHSVDVNVRPYALFQETWNNIQWPGGEFAIPKTVQHFIFLRWLG